MSFCMKGDKSQRGIIIIKNELYIFMGENIKNLEYFKRHENVYYFDRDYSNENRVSLNKSVLSLNTRKILVIIFRLIPLRKICSI